MEITLLDDARPGQPVSVRSQSGEWIAIWKGESRENRGYTCQVEVEIEEIEPWKPAETESEFIGIKTTEGRTIVCGSVSVTYDDGALALDLEPGAVLIDPEISPQAQAGQRICIIAHIVEIFPTEA